MVKHPVSLLSSITDAVRDIVADASTVTAYRAPLVGFADAHDPRFRELRRVADLNHLMPQDLLPGAQSVISFFVPFGPGVVKANAGDREEVAREWALAYVETNELITRTAGHLVKLLSQHSVRAASEPPTDSFDPVKLVSQWSHKSVAVIAGLGSFGLHHMVITDAGCAGRFGSVVTDAPLPSTSSGHKERCLYFYDGSCRSCITRCPVGALNELKGIDKQRCWSRCLEVAEFFSHLGSCEVCGKCAIGPCAFQSAV